MNEEMKEKTHDNGVSILVTMGSEITKIKWSKNIQSSIFAPSSGN